MKKTHTILKLILSIIVTILAIGLLVLFLRIIKNKDQNISVVIATLQEKMKEKEDAAIFAEKVTEIKLLQDSTNSHFVDSDKIDTFVGYLEEMGSSLGSEVSIKNIEIPEKTKKLISFKLSILGTFQEVMKTITFLENIPYQINITQVYLNKEIQESPQGSIEDKKDEIIQTTSNWQADVSFNILSLN
jgi:hypothetical protein